MNRFGVVSCPVLTCLFLFHASVFAQDVPTGPSAVERVETQRAREMQATIDSVRKAQDDLGKNIQLPILGPTRNVNVRTGPSSRMLLAIPKFREATDQYRLELSRNGKLKKPLRTIKDQTDVMLDSLLRSSNMNPPVVNPAEFKDYSKAELQWETLTVMERISSFADHVVEVQREDTLSVSSAKFLYQFNGDLQRLKWLAAHTK